MGQKHNKKLWCLQVQTFLMKEDQVLKQAVQLINNDKWNDIASEYQKLFYQKYTRESKRSGKQCRQRWYNKLHPALQNNNEEWCHEEMICLIDLYKELGPKWAKIILRLCQYGFTRRSDNGIKNHFHMLVKKSIKELNNFVEDFNRKGKENGLFYQKPKKKYFYPKTYSIERMVKMAVRVDNSQASQQVQRVPIQERNQVPIEKQSEAVKNQEGTTQKLQEIKEQAISKDQNEQGNLQLQSANRQSKGNILFKINQEGNNVSLSNLPLRLIDKRSIDKMLLFIYDKKVGRFPIPTQSSNEDNLQQVRNSFLQYVKSPQSFNHGQLRELVEKIYNQSKYCKKLGQKAIALKIKQRQTLSKFEMQKTTKKLYQKILKKFPDHRNAFLKNKAQMRLRLYFLAEKVYQKQQQLGQQVKRQYFLRRQEEQKIIGMIIPETLALYEQKLEQKHQKRGQKKQEKQDKTIKKRKIIQSQPSKENHIFCTELKITEDDIKEGKQKTCKTKRIRRITKRQVRKPRDIGTSQDQEHNQQQLQNDGNIQCQMNHNINEFRINQNPLISQKVPFLPEACQINQQNQPLIQNAVQTVLVKQEDLERPSMRKIQRPKTKTEQNTTNPFTIFQQSNYQQDPLKEQNIRLPICHPPKFDQIFSNSKSPSMQLIFKIPLKRPYEDKHIESENSEISLKSKKSLRPNRILSQDMFKLQEPQKRQVPFQGFFQCQQGGGFTDLKRQFPNILIQSKDYGQPNQFSKEARFFNLKEPVSPINSSKSNFMLFNLEGKVPIRQFSLNNNPFKQFSNSQQFIGFNNSGCNQGITTNSNMVDRKQSIYKSCDFLAMSCQNQDQFKVSGEMQAVQEKQKQANFFDNSFLQNIRNVAEHENPQGRQAKVFDFLNGLPQKTPQQGASNSNKSFTPFNPFSSQPLDFDIPQKLIETAKNSNFPIRNHNHYSLNYHHVNSVQVSKIFEFDKKFGLNSARLSEIDFLKSSEKEEDSGLKSKELDGASNMFKSQRIKSLHGSCQFLNKSRQLSNSCIYSIHEQKSVLGNKNQMNPKKV